MMYIGALKGATAYEFQIEKFGIRIVHLVSALAQN
jgi:hypothetical protein